MSPVRIVVTAPTSALETGGRPVPPVAAEETVAESLRGELHTRGSVVRVERRDGAFSKGETRIMRQRACTLSYVAMGFRGDSQ